MCRRISCVALAALVAATLIGGCKLSRPPTVAEILKEPAKYEGKPISVKGTVREPLQFFGHGVCKLDDGTGKLTVITAGTSRSNGAEATITGTVESAFTLGDNTLVVLVEQGAKAEKER